MTKEDNLLQNEQSIIIGDENYFYGKVKPKVKLTEQERKQILAAFPIPKMPDSRESVKFGDFKPNENANNLTVLVNSFEVRFASNNNPFLDIVLSNTSGSFKAKMWSDNTKIQEHTEFFTLNKVITVSGKVEEYPKDSGNKSLTIRSFLPIKGEVNMLELLPVSDKSIEDMTLELVYYIKQIEEPHRSIALIGLKKVWNGFRLSPAAKFHHHAYLGGLLKHTLGLVRLAWYIGKKFDKPSFAMFELLEEVLKEHKKEIAYSIIEDAKTPYKKLTWGDSVEHIYQTIYQFSTLSKDQDFNINLLISSIVWHDIGKHFELSYAGDDVNKYRALFPYANDINSFGEKYNTHIAGFEMDQLGSLVGHIPFGVLLLQRTLDEGKVSVGLDVIHEYMHNILSHHGKLEWGSPTAPKTPTAVALHFVDYLDSRYESYELKNK